MQCPICKNGSTLYRCDYCQDTRCNSSSCTGSLGVAKGGGFDGKHCSCCKKGKYRKV